MSEGLLAAVVLLVMWVLGTFSLTPADIKTIPQMPGKDREL